MRTPLVVGCIDILLPVFTKIINLSLQTGSFASSWKCALVHPLLEKLLLDLSAINLQYISNLSEKTVFSQTHKYMVVNEIYPCLQSPYCHNHSTATAFLKVMDNVLLKMNSPHVTVMVLLDLTSTFDTFDHNREFKGTQSAMGPRCPGHYFASLESVYLNPKSNLRVGYI